MKKHLSLLILFAVIVGYVGFGQTPVSFGVDTIHVDSSKIILNKGWIDLPNPQIIYVHPFNNQRSSPQQEQDTIPCVMLVCDTSRWEGKEYTPIMSGGTIKDGVADFSNMTQVGVDSSNTIIADYDEKVFWIKGYEVVHVIDNLIVLDWQQQSNNVTYLDENKQPLKPSIIVWLSK